MKIKRFFENEAQSTKNEVQGPQGSVDAFNDISNDKLDEIIATLTESITSISEKLRDMKKVESDLSKFKSKSKSKMDQIDDSFIQLGKINKQLQIEILGKIDSVINKLKDRKDNGQNYIYKK